MRGLLDRRIDARPYAFARILVGLAGLVLTFEWQVILNRAASGHFLRMPSVTWLPLVTPGMVDILTTVSVVAAVGMAIGIWPRVSSAILSIVVVYVLLLEQQAYSNHLVLLGCLAGLLSLAQSDRVWTLVGRRRGSRVPFWPGFLIMSLISSLYFWTALSKINSEFLSGNVLVESIRPGVPFSAGAGVVLAIASIGTELFLAFALWARATRRIAYVVGAGLHLSIVCLLSDPVPLVLFALLMMSGYVLFLAEDLDDEGPRTLRWDSELSSLNKWIAVFRVVDLFGVQKIVGSKEGLVDADLQSLEIRESMTLTLVSRRHQDEGFDAMRRVFEASPLTFWVAPIMGFPPFRRLGLVVWRRTDGQQACKNQMTRYPN